MAGRTETLMTSIIPSVTLDVLKKVYASYSRIQQKEQPGTGILQTYTAASNIHSILKRGM